MSVREPYSENQYLYFHVLEFIPIDMKSKTKFPRNSFNLQLKV